MKDNKTNNDYCSNVTVCYCHMTVMRTVGLIQEVWKVVRGKEAFKRIHSEMYEIVVMVKEKKEV